MDIIADVAFLVDIVLQFNLAYYASGDRHQLVLVTSRADIRRNYLKGWFWLDVVAVIPFNLIEQHLGTGDSACGESNINLGAEGSVGTERDDPLSSSRAMLLLTCVAQLTREHGHVVRQGWRKVADCVLCLHELGCLPHDVANIQGWSVVGPENTLRRDIGTALVCQCVYSI